MHVILRTISSFFPHQKILFLSKVMPLKICDTSPGLSISMYLLPTSYLPVTPTAIILHVFAKFFVLCIARPFGFLKLISFSDFLTASCVLTSQSGCG